MPSGPPSPQARQLGADLRKAREAAGVSGKEVARVLGKRHPSSVYRIETGEYVPSADDVSRICDVLGVTGAQRDQLVEQALSTNDPNWVTPGLRRDAVVMRSYETRAAQITNVEPLLVPGLCQTSAYYRTLLIGAGLDADTADEWTRYRSNRRDVLFGDNPARLVVIMGEYALRYPPCDDAVADEQLRFLLEMSHWPNVEMLILPIARIYTPALEGGFSLIEPPAVVYQEGYRAASTLTDEKDVSDYLAAIEVLRHHALSREQSRRLIAGEVHER